MRNRDIAHGPADGNLIVQLEAIRKSYGSFVALDNVDLTVGEGEFVTLLGPSGSGKTTCLRAIAGMLVPDSGRLLIAGRDMAGVPMHKRNIGMVFQNYSLFPHMTVAQNVAYPLRVRGVGPTEIAQRVATALDMVRLTAFGDRSPDRLSGGQQQRVALARALVFRPDVLLLDEPLSALDRVLREELQYELRRIHRETGMTMICVTHDRVEALAMSDRVVVMRAGAIVQRGTPRDIYETSSSRFVAEFLGEINLIAMTVRGPGELVDDVGRPLAVEASAAVGGRVEVAFRVEATGLTLADANRPSNWQGEVREALFVGDAIRFVIECTPHFLYARVQLDRARGIVVGSQVDVDLLIGTPMVFAAA